MLVYGVVVRLMANEDIIVFTFLGKKNKNAFLPSHFYLYSALCNRESQSNFTIICKISDSVMQTYEINSNSALNS